MILTCDRDLGLAANPEFDCEPLKLGECIGRELEHFDCNLLGVWARSSIKVSKEAEMRVIGCDVTDAEGVYSNEKVVRMSEVGILAFGKSEVMKG